MLIANNNETQNQLVDEVERPKGAATNFESQFNDDYKIVYKNGSWGIDISVKENGESWVPYERYYTFQGCISGLVLRLYQTTGKGDIGNFLLIREQVVTWVKDVFKLYFELDPKIYIDIWDD